jgi:hypothetical protein
MENPGRLDGGRLLVDAAFDMAIMHGNTRA